MKTNKTSFTLKEIYTKMEYYCSYQERCYKEVEEKLYSFSLSNTEKETVLTHLIENNFINEERFVKVLRVANTIINFGAKSYCK